MAKRKLELTKDEGLMVAKLLEGKKFTIEQPGDRKVCEAAHEKVLDYLADPTLFEQDDDSNDDDDD